MLCLLCNHDPCHRIVYADQIRWHVSAISSDTSPNVAHRSLYEVYTHAVYGTLGHGNHVDLPACIVSYIRELFPDPDGEYMGYKPE